MTLNLLTSQKALKFGRENKTKANVTLLSGRLGAALHQHKARRATLITGWIEKSKTSWADYREISLPFNDADRKNRGHGH